eukprot:327888_1
MKLRKHNAPRKLRTLDKHNYNLDEQEMKTSIPFMPYDEYTAAQIKKLPVGYEPVSRVYMPQLMDNGCWVECHITGQKRPKLITCRAAIHLYPGNKQMKLKSYLTFLNENRNHHMISNILWKTIQNQLYEKLTPKFEKHDYCVLIGNDLELELQFVKITSLAKRKTILFNDKDEYKLYNIQHFDPRCETLTFFNRETGAEFGLKRSSGAVQESMLIKISSEQIIDNGMDVGYIIASNHYLRLRNESLISNIKSVTNVCHLTAKQTVQAISQKIRGRCIKKNESKIFTDTYVVAGAIQTSTILPKFASMKQLSSYKDFMKKGESIYSLFDCIQASEIYQSENLNRDYNDEGAELFNDGSTDEKDVDFTMSTSAVLHRCIPDERQNGNKSVRMQQKNQEKEKEMKFR